MKRSSKALVPECRASLEQMKYEIAAELGLCAPSVSLNGHEAEFADELGASHGQARHAASSIKWDSLQTRQAGAVGGAMTRRLVAAAQQALGVELPEL